MEHTILTPSTSGMLLTSRRTLDDSGCPTQNLSASGQHQSAADGVWMVWVSKYGVTYHTQFNPPFALQLHRVVRSDDAGSSSFSWTRCCCFEHFYMYVLYQHCIVSHPSVTTVFKRCEYNNLDIFAIRCQSFRSSRFTFRTFQVPF